MSTGTKVFRAHCFGDHGEMFTCNSVSKLSPENCTVIPDGAPIPLPADVRRVLHDLYDQKRPEHKARKLPHATWLEIGRILGCAEKRRKAGGR